MNEELLIHKMFTQVSLRFPEKVCLQIKKDFIWQRWTYRQLQEQALKIAGFLIAEGLKKGDFACLILENRPEWPAIYLGIVAAGLSCVPLDVQLSPGEIKNLILDSGTKIIFTSCEIFAQKVKQAIEGTNAKAVVLEDDEIKVKNTSYENINWPEVNPSDTASLIYTSGTTGKPKGVMLTHKNICSNFLSIKELKIMCFSSDNFLSILPLHHTYPFMVNLIMPLLIGATITYLPSGFRSQELSLVIKEAGVTIVVGVPRLFSLLHAGISEKLKRIPGFLMPLALIFVRRKVSKNFGRTLRYLASGGARLEPKIARDLSKWGLKISEGYGLTETSPIVTLNPLKKVKFGSCGKPIPGVQIRIFNPQALGIGQILIKGPNVMQGYFKQPELTAEVLKDGWFYSGDLGYIDQQGYLLPEERKKLLF